MCGEVFFSEPQLGLRWNGVTLAPGVSGLEQTPGIVAIQSDQECASPKLTLTGDITLHNRPDLLDKLGRDLRTACPPSDGQLVMASYEKWGESCSEFLVGEFTFAIWDFKRQRLFCCID